MFKRLIILIAATLFSQSVFAHPHIFAEARLEIETTGDGKVMEFRHVWQFDEVFTASVVLDFDKNRNLDLDQDELEEIGEIVRQSLREHDYYTFVSVDGQNIDMATPSEMRALYKDAKLIFVFALEPVQTVSLSQNISTGVYDPTMYTSIDFYYDNDMVITGPYADRCNSQVVRPDADEVIAQNSGSLDEAFYSEEETNDLSKLFATRIEFSC